MSYGARELAAGFRTVRKNTILIAEDIPADQYSFRAAPDIRTAGEMLAHIAVSTWWALQVHGGDRKSHVSFDDWRQLGAESAAQERALDGKAAILEALRQRGDEFAAFLESLDDNVLAEEVTFPPQVQPPSRSRLEMLLSVKEHEMHHRGQLMLIERLIGIVPHLTRARS